MPASRFAFAAAAILLLSIGAAPAFAERAFWHGSRSGNWNDGIRPQANESNWYSRPPPDGRPRPVPDDTAVFPPGADSLEITIDEPTLIGTLIFERAAKRYRIVVDNPLTVVGRGVVTEGSRSPHFQINSAMTLVGTADGGNATYSIGNAGKLDAGVGSEAGGLVNLGKVANSGRLVGGLASLVIQDFEQRRDGLLRLEINPLSHSVIQASRLTIAGDIVVEGRKDVGPGDYLVITFGQRVGKFRREVFEGFSANLDARLVYKLGYIFVRLTER